MLGFDLNGFHDSYRSRGGKGAPLYDPGIMLKVLIYRYSSGVLQSEKIVSSSHLIRPGGWEAEPPV